MNDFFDPKKNPFFSMMNPQGADGDQKNLWIPPFPMPGPEQSMKMMQQMTQMFQTQMKLTQMMWTMPMRLMQYLLQK